MNPCINRVIISMILLFLSFSSIAQSRKGNDSLHTILLISLTTRKMQIEAEVAPRFGFRYKILPAKGVDSFIIYPNIDSMRKHNKAIYKLIAEINGSNWRKRFDKEVNRVYKNEISLDNFFENDTGFIKIRDAFTKDIDADNRYSFKVQREVKRNKIFLVNYYFYTKVNDEIILNDSKTLMVYLRKREIKIP